MKTIYVVCVMVDGIRHRQWPSEHKIIEEGYLKTDIDLVCQAIDAMVIDARFIGNYLKAIDLETAKFIVTQITDAPRIVFWVMAYDKADEDFIYKQLQLAGQRFLEFHYADLPNLSEVLQRQEK